MTNLARIATWLIIGIVLGCATPGGPVDHSYTIRTGAFGQTVTDVSFRYGSRSPYITPKLGWSGTGETAVMPLADVAEVRWVDTSGKRQERRIRVRDITPPDIQGKDIVFEIHDVVLKVFVDTRLPNFQRSRRLIYSDD